MFIDAALGRMVLLVSKTRARHATIALGIARVRTLVIVDPTSRRG